MTATATRLGHFIMPSVTVGGRTCPVGWAEFLAAIMPKGTPVSFRRRKGPSGPVEYGSGIYTGSTFYDGITAYIDIGGRTEHLFLSMGDRMKRIKHDSELPFLGDGI